MHDAQTTPSSSSPIFLTGLFSLFQASRALDKKLEVACSDPSCPISHIESLVSRGANPFSNGQALLGAIQTRRDKVLVLLLNAPAPCPSPETPHRYKDKALFLACQTNDPISCELVRILLKHGADPNADRGRALHLAVAQNFSLITKLLLENGARATDSYTNILFMPNSYELSAQPEHEAKYFHRRTNYNRPTSAGTLPALVGRSGNVQLFKCLESHGMMMHTKSTADAMTDAVYTEKEDMIRALWSYPGAQDAFFRASVHRAAREGWVYEDCTKSPFLNPCLTTLVHKMGAPFLMPFGDTDGGEAIRDAAWHGQLESVKFLLQCHDANEIAKHPNAERLSAPTPTLGLVTRAAYLFAVSIIFPRAASTITKTETTVDVCFWILDEFCYTELLWLDDIPIYNLNFKPAVFRRLLHKIKTIVSGVALWDTAATNETWQVLERKLSDILCVHHNMIAYSLEFLNDFVALVGDKHPRLTNLFKTITYNLRTYMSSAGIKVLSQEREVILEWAKKYFSKDDLFWIFDSSSSSPNNFHSKAECAEFWLPVFWAHGLFSASDVLLKANKFGLLDLVGECLAQGAAFPRDETLLAELVKYGRDASLLRDYFAAQKRERVFSVSMASKLAIDSTRGSSATDNTITSNADKALVAHIKMCIEQNHEAALVEILLHCYPPPAMLDCLMSTALFLKRRRIVLLLSLYGCRVRFDVSITFDQECLRYCCELLDSHVLQPPVYFGTRLSWISEKSTTKIREMSFKDQDRILHHLFSGNVILTQYNCFIECYLDRYNTNMINELVFEAILQGEFEHASQWIEKYQVPDEVWMDGLFKSAILHDQCFLFKFLMSVSPMKTHTAHAQLLDFALSHDRVSIILILLSDFSLHPNERACYDCVLEHCLRQGNLVVFRALETWLGQDHVREKVHYFRFGRWHFGRNLADLGLPPFSKLERFETAPHFFTTCASVAHEFPFFYQDLFNIHFFSQNAPIFQVRHRDALFRVFGLLDEKGVAEFVSVLLKNLNAYQSPGLLDLFLRACMDRFPRSVFMTPWLSKLIAGFFSPASSADLALSDETVKLFCKCLDTPLSKLKGILSPIRRARFARQDWFAVYSVIQTLASETYKQQDGNPVEDYPLPLQLLEHVTTQECWLDVLACRTESKI